VSVAVPVAPEVVSVAPEAVSVVVSVADEPVSVAVPVAPEVASVAPEAVSVAIPVAPAVVSVAASVAPEGVIEVVSVVLEAVGSWAEALGEKTAKRTPIVTRSATNMGRALALPVVVLPFTFMRFRLARFIRKGEPGGAPRNRCGLALCMPEFEPFHAQRGGPDRLRCRPIA
jgi:hypothetical protein